MSEQDLINAAEASVLAYNNKDWAAVRNSVTPNVKYDEVASNRKLEGIEQLLEVWQGWASAFPDSKATLHSSLVSGNKVVLEMTWKGTHTAPMQSPKGEIPATNKRIDMRAIQVVTVTSGKVSEAVHYFDMMTMMTQLGLAG